MTVAMFDPMAKDCVVAPAASEALVSNCRYSRESEYSLSKNTHTHTTQISSDYTILRPIQVKSDIKTL